MNSTLKRFAVMLMVVIAAMCMAVLAACTDGEDKKDEYATDTFVVTVLYADGTPVDGTTGMDELAGEDEDPHTSVTIQFCHETMGCFNEKYVLDKNGKTTVNLSEVKESAKTYNTEEVVIQVNNVSYLGYYAYEHYGPYNVNKFPLELTITLKMPQA